MLLIRHLARAWPGFFSALWYQWGHTLSWAPLAQSWLHWKPHDLPPWSCSVISPHLEESHQCTHWAWRPAFLLSKKKLPGYPWGAGAVPQSRVVSGGGWADLTVLRNIPILSGKDKMRGGIFVELLKIVRWRSRKVKIKQKHWLDLSDILDIFEKNLQTGNLLAYIVTSIFTVLS